MCDALNCLAECCSLRLRAHVGRSGECHSLEIKRSYHSGDEDRAATMCATDTVGPYVEGTESWELYQERLEQHFIAKDITADAQSCARLISIMISSMHICMCYLETICIPISTSCRLRISCTGDSLVYGTTCTFECDQGYPLIGSSVALCDRNNDQEAVGFWNYENGTETPFCESKSCINCYILILVSFICCMMALANNNYQV